MRANLYDVRTKAETAVEAEPRCGEDFCDDCGDCLACYDGDPCYPSEGYHVWVVYSDQEAEWRANHPEARPA